MQQDGDVPRDTLVAEWPRRSCEVAKQYRVVNTDAETGRLVKLDYARYPTASVIHLAHLCVDVYTEG